MLQQRWNGRTCVLCPSRPKTGSTCSFYPECPCDYGFRMMIELVGTGGGRWRRFQQTPQPAPTSQQRQDHKSQAKCSDDGSYVNSKRRNSNAPRKLFNRSTRGHSPRSRRKLQFQSEPPRYMFPSWRRRSVAIETGRSWMPRSNSSQFSSDVCQQSHDLAASLFAVHIGNNFGHIGRTAAPVMFVPSFDCY